MSGLPAMLGVNFAALIAVVLILWGVAVRIRDVSFIDAFWAFGMVLLAWASVLQVGAGAPHGLLLLGLSTLVESSLIVTGHNFGRHGRRQF